MLLRQKLEALQDSLLQRREPLHLRSGDPVLPRNLAQLLRVRPRPPLELPSLIPPTVQETPTSNQGPDAEQHREWVGAIDRGQGRKPCKRGERGDAKDRPPQPSVPLSDRIHYAPTLVLAAPQALWTSKVGMWTSEVGRAILLILSCAFTITYSFPPYRAALGDRLTLVHPALSRSPWLALASPAAACSVVPQTLKLVTTSATLKISAQKPILTLRTGSPPSGHIGESVGLE